MRRPAPPPDPAESLRRVLGASPETMGRTLSGRAFVRLPSEDLPARLDAVRR